MKLACLLLAVCPLAAGQQSMRELAAAKEAVRLGHLTQARIELQKAVDDEPSNAGAQLELGLVLGQCGDVPGANAAFRKAVQAKPEWPEAHYNLGLSLIADATAKRDWPGAIAEFREAVRLRPAYAEGHHLLGVALEETGERAASIAELRMALAISPNSAEIHLDLGKALEAAGESAGVESAYRAALALRPEYAAAEIALGKLLLKNESKSLEAIEHLRRALRENPDDSGAQYLLAKALQRGGRLAAAAVAFRQAAALAKRPEDAVQCTRLSNEGLDAAHAGNVELALKRLKEAVELRPDSALAHYNFGLILADHGELGDAQAEVVKAISLMPVDARFYAALERMGKKPAQGEPFGYGAAADTPEGHFAFATALAQKGDWLGAIGEWLRVLAQRPSDVDARNNLGVSYDHAGKSDKAELEFRKALQVLPDSAGAHFGLAVLALQNGKKTDALSELREVIRIRPDYPQAQNLLASVSR